MPLCQFYSHDPTCPRSKGNRRGERITDQKPSVGDHHRVRALCSRLPGVYIYPLLSPSFCLSCSSLLFSCLLIPLELFTISSIFISTLATPYILYCDRPGQILPTQFGAPTLLPRSAFSIPAPYLFFLLVLGFFISTHSLDLFSS